MHVPATAVMPTTCLGLITPALTHPFWCPIARDTHMRAWQRQARRPLSWSSCQQESLKALPVQYPNSTTQQESLNKGQKGLQTFYKTSTTPVASPKLM